MTEGWEAPNGPDFEDFSEGVKELIEDAMKELRKDIISASRSLHSARPTPPAKIGRDDVRAALDQFGLMSRGASAHGHGRPGRKYYFMAAVGMLAGSASIVIGAAINYLIIDADSFDLENIDYAASLISAFAALLGLLVAIYAFISAREASRESEGGTSDVAIRLIAETSIVTDWMEFERVLRHRFADPQISSRPIGVGHLIQAYGAEVRLSPKEMDEIRSTLRIRNHIVHGMSGSDFDKDSIAMARGVIKKHLDRIQNLPQSDA